VAREGAAERQSFRHGRSGSCAFCCRAAKLYLLPVNSDRPFVDVPRADGQTVPAHFVRKYVRVYVFWYSILHACMHSRRDFSLTLQDTSIH